MFIIIMWKTERNVCFVCGSNVVDRDRNSNAEETGENNNYNNGNIILSL